MESVHHLPTDSRWPLGPELCHSSLPGTWRRVRSILAMSRALKTIWRGHEEYLVWGLAGAELGPSPPEMGTGGRGGELGCLMFAVSQVICGLRLSQGDARTLRRGRSRFHSQECGHERD